MKRPMGVMVSAAAALSSSLFLLGVGLWVAVTFMVFASRDREMTWVVFAFSIGCHLITAIIPGLFGVAMGIGLFFGKNWARRLILGVATTLALSGGIGVLFELGRAGSQRTSGYLLAYLLGIALGGGWLYLFNTPAIKRQFLGSAPKGEPPQQS